MRLNTTRERLAKGETVYGCGLQVYRAPEIPRLFATAGFDYHLIKPVSFDELEAIIETAPARSTAGPKGNSIAG